VNNKKEKGEHMKATATTLLLAIVSSLAFSVQAETVTQALEKCRGVDNSLQRLVCYDRVAKNVNQYAGGQESISAVPRPQLAPANAPEAPMPPPPAKPSVSSTPSAKPTVDNNATEDIAFGMEQKRVREQKEASMVATVAALSSTVRGSLIVTFDNGTVWQQSDDTDLNLKEGQKVVVERGMFGAFYAKVEGIKRKMKVKRIK